MRINIVKEITIKELKAQFDQLSGYILISIFLGLVYFFFLKTFFLNGVASMRNVFQLIPWYMAIFIPAITMGSFASEFEKQTLEYIETKPVKQMELIVGKILGAAKIAFIAVLLTLPLPIFISRLAPLDLGETLSGYFGALVLSLALASLGVAVSTFYKNQIAAFITSAVLIVALLIINTDITAINLPVSIANSLAQFSIIDNYEPMVRGVINLNNLIYFVIFIVTSVAIAYTNVQKIRISSTTELYKKTFATIILVAIAGVILVYLSDYFGQQIGRIDLTTDKRYTLSPVTKEILREEGKIIAEVFASDNLPPVHSKALEEIKNILADYKSASGGNLEVRYLDPKVNGERISTLNIQPVQFNTVGEDELQIQQGYLAIALMNEDETKKEKIDYLTSVNDLEYQLTSFISKIKSKSKPVIGFATGNGEKGIFTEYNYLQQIFQSEYDIRTVYLSPAEMAADQPEPKETDPNLSQYQMLILAGPKNNYSEDSLNKIHEYINGGGNVIYLGDTKSIDNETGAVTSLDETGRIFERYGATVNNDMAYDLQSSLQIPISETLSTKYPYFVIAEKDSASENAMQFLPETVITPWAASLNLDGNWQWLYSTSSSGGTQTGAINIDPQAELPDENLRRIPLIAMRKNGESTLVIAGSSKMFEDLFTSSIQQNTVLALAFFEQLGNGRPLSQIKVKNLMGSQFTTVNDNIKGLINYGAPLTSGVLLLLIGASRIYRKRKLAKVYA